MATTSISSNLPSYKLSQIFDTLPPEAQQRLVEKHLFLLLDSVSKDVSDSVLTAATELQTRLRSMPKLDLKSKKREVDGLMEALSRDAKTAITKERSNREELLTEVVDSLTSWLNDIWTVVYDCRDDFFQAHLCLLYTTKILSSLPDVPGVGSCQCFVLNIPIDITIRRKNGTIIKIFTFKGPQAVSKAVLWIWRELFVSLSAYGTLSMRKRMPDMIEDIESLMGWEALERLLYGGKSSLSHDPLSLNESNTDNTDEEDENNDENEYDEYDDETDICFNSDDDEELGEERCICAWHMKHWSDLIHRQRIYLRELVESRLHTNFRQLPSIKLYHAIRNISYNHGKTDTLLSTEIADNATNSSETFVNALEIYSVTGRVSEIESLLCSHYHLLRVRDATVLQRAVAVMIASPFSARAVQILDQELLDTIRSIHMAVVSVFGNVGLDEHKKDIDNILKMRRGTQERRDRIRRWVDNITTHSTSVNPMAFAAMVMGIPMGGAEEGSQEDIATFLDGMDTSDPDWADIVEEYKPKLKERFDGWCKLLTAYKLSHTLLSKLYFKTIELMPFLRGGEEVVDALVFKIDDMQGKLHISEGLQALSSFCIVQHKRIQRRRRANEKAMENEINSRTAQ